MPAAYKQNHFGLKARRRRRRPVQEERSCIQAMTKFSPQHDTETLRAGWFG